MRNERSQAAGQVMDRPVFPDYPVDRSVSYCFDSLQDFGLETLPRVPTLIATHLQIELLLQQPVVELRAVADIILRDPGATLEILRLAGREWAFGEERATRIEDAVAGLSLESCREAIAGGVLGHDLRHPAVAAAWEHAHHIAQSMHTAAALEGSIGPEQAYLVGLLHELGGVPALLGWPLSDAENASRAGRPGARTGMSVARSLAEQWRLPWFLIAAFAELVEGRRTSPWVRLLAAAHGWEEADRELSYACVPTRPAPRRSRVLSFDSVASIETQAWKTRGRQHQASTMRPPA